MNKITTLSMYCPKCDARPGKRCTSSRASSCNSYGGGWGGYAELSRSHTERVQLAKKAQANREKALSACRTMKSLTPPQD